MTDEAMSQLRTLSRQRLRMIWSTPDSESTQLSDEDRVLLDVLRMHPDYYDLWDRLDEVSDEELQRDGTNPILHVTFHQIIENQLAAGDPPETAEALNRLLAQGTTRHEALHQLGGVLAEEMYVMLKHQQEYDQARYVKKLNKLGQPRRRFRGRRKGRN